MFNKKITVDANKTTLVLYENSCVSARGGRRHKILTPRKEWKEAYKLFQDDSCYIPVLAPSETEFVASYHSKNYIQRKKLRNKAVEELVQNNFEPKNCLFITLNFDAKTYTAEPPSNYASPPPTEKEENSEDTSKLLGYGFAEMDLVTLSNSILSSPNQTTEIKPADVEPELKITNEGYQNLDICYGEFKKFIKKMNYRYNGFKYVAVFDRQKNTGNWHYHLICNLDYVDFEELKNIWALGGVYIQRIKNKVELETVVKYCEKNMTSACGSLRGEKGYYASRGLNRSKICRSWKDNELKEFNKYEQVVKQAASNGLKPTMNISEHKYKGRVNIDDILEGEEERICTVKYYSYRIDSSNEFTKTIAEKKKQK